MAIQASRISVNKSTREEMLVNTFYALINDFFISPQNSAHGHVRLASIIRDGHWQTRCRLIMPAKCSRRSARPAPD
jgi:hypothetical protein